MATPTWGTHGVLDTRAARIAGSTPAIDIQGEIAAEIRRLNAIHNAQVMDMFGEFVAGTTTEQYAQVDAIGEMTLTELDEWGTPEAQKTAGGSAFGLPFRLYSRGLQWNYRFLKTASASDYLGDTAALQGADIRKTKAEFLKALFRPTNYTFKDHLYNNASLDVKALANADSMYIPPTPSGATIDASTHTHYLANATLTAAFMIACGDTVAQHFNTGRTVITIPLAAEGTVRAMTGTNEFVPYPNPAVTYAPDTVVARGRSLDINQTYDRAIGVIGPSAYEVRVKPWTPDNYGTVHQQGGPKVMVKRISPVGDEQGLHVRFNGEIDPLVADVMETLYGFGIINRVAAACFRFNNASYSMPTITE